jgi:hypothetical protein
MPRSLLEILLEKKDPKKSLPYPTRDQFNAQLSALEDICRSNLSGLYAVEGFGGVNTFGTIRDQFKDCQNILKKYRLEWKDYPWNDPTVQKGLVTQKETIFKLIKDLEKARIESLGEGDSYRIANTYFETGESLRVTGTQKILKIASMRDKELKVDRTKANTDITQNNEINKDKLDITAKKVPDRTVGEKPSGMSDDDYAKLQETIRKDNEKIAEDNIKRKEEVARLRMGIFYYLGMIVGETQDEVKKKWGGGKDGEDNASGTEKEYRTELLVKAMPFIEKVTQKDFNEKDPLGDKEYMNYIMILGSYTPGYKNYKPDPKDKEVEVEITKDQYAVIKGEMENRQKEINVLIDQIKARHTGSGPIDKAITAEMEEAQKDLKSVEPQTACDANSKAKLRDSREKLREKVNKNKDLLKKEDIEDLGKVAEIIGEISNFCNGKKYIKEDKK